MSTTNTTAPPPPTAPTPLLPEPLIETLNALSLPAFCTRFWPRDQKIVGASDGQEWGLELESSSTVSVADFMECFGLIEHTSSADYASSSLGWHPAKKRKEMRLLDLKYVLLKEKTTAAKAAQEDGISNVQGFLSFMFTYEDGIEVVYCYEIHLSESVRGKGVGKKLMGLFEEVGRKAGVRKAMLTVFRKNVAAVGFYHGLGYRVDDFSPRARKLRGGILKEVDYVILSKPLTSVDTHRGGSHKKLKAT